jgi:hypothetical protein
MYAVIVSKFTVIILAQCLLLFTWTPQAQQLLVVMLVQVFMRTLV